MAASVTLCAGMLLEPQLSAMSIFEKAPMILAAFGAPAAVWLGNAVADWIRRPGGGDARTEAAE